MLRRDAPGAEKAAYLRGIDYDGRDIDKAIATGRLPEYWLINQQDDLLLSRIEEPAHAADTVWS